MKTLSLLGLLLFSFICLPAQIDLQLELVSDAFFEPVDITHAGDDRLFVVQKNGIIYILNPDDQANASPFLDIDSRVRSSGGERGLLGLAFHPNYAENGYFFVNYTNLDGHTVVARYQVSGDDPDLADFNSEKILFTVNQPFANHNGGDLNFGPDGYLYIALGDGGSANDPQNNGQKRQTMLGKILRIDVDNGDPYAIPQDNPFAETDETLDEIWALGLRNPWRFSFDRLTGDLWIGDVGQGDWEEIDFQAADSEGGENYGWRCYEGDAAFNTDGCIDASNYRFPVHAYQSNLPNGCSVTGGFVYRGATFPLLYGKYIYADYCSGKIWALEQNESEEWINTELFDGPGGQYVSFGEDAQGELYLTSLGGNIFQVRDLTITSTVDNSLDARLQVRPNPFDREIWVEGTLPAGGLYSMRLLNAQGQLLWESTRLLEIDFQQKVTTDDLPKGVYFFRLEHDGKGKMIKLIKQ